MPKVIAIVVHNIYGCIPLIWPIFSFSDLEQTAKIFSSINTEFLTKDQSLGMDVVPADAGEQTAICNQKPVNNNPGDILFWA